MAVEYNLVILGDSPVARYAAEYARSLNARVALVTGISSQSDYRYPIGVYADTLMLQALRRGAGERGSGGAGERGSANPKSKIQNLKSKISLAQTLIEGQFEGRSLSALEQMGVDVVYANDKAKVLDDDSNSPGQTSLVEFCGSSTVTLKTRRRNLSSQAYLIAMGGEPVVPSIPGIEQVPYETLDTFFHARNSIESASIESASILIVSNNQQGIEAACALGSLGASVTLVMDTPSLIEDEEANQWLNSSLFALGVRVHWETSIVRLEQRDGQCVAQLEGPEPRVLKEPWALVADRLLFAMGRQVDFTALQLGTVGVAYDAQGIRINSRYQSSHSRLFACGDAIGSEPRLNQRYGEVAIAIHHALFGRALWSNAWLSNLLLRGLKQWLKPALPTIHPPQSPLGKGGSASPPPYQGGVRGGGMAIPNIINVNPPIAYIGYSEQEARQQYGNASQKGRAEGLTVLRQPYGSLDQAQLLGASFSLSTTGWCKLLVLEDGQIIGAYIWGVQAEEAIGVIALAMRHSIPMEELGQLCPPMPSITAELLQALAMQWQRERIKGRSLLFDWLELFFNWQRDWTKG